jgi:hypothetical protein
MVNWINDVLLTNDGTVRYNTGTGTLYNRIMRFYCNSFKHKSVYSFKQYSRALVVLLTVDFSITCKFALTYSLQQSCSGTVVFAKHLPFAV